MIFKDFDDLVNIVNTTLGNFCNQFGQKRKELAHLGKLPKRGILFAYDKNKGRDWAINEGGGTEIQYHIAFDKKTLILRYGLGFNTQYVQFANAMSMVDYMKPFMKGFLKNEVEISRILPNYNFIIGNKSLLQFPKNNEYVLFGKELKAKKTGANYDVSAALFNEMISDFKLQLKAFEIIFKEKNNSKKAVMNIEKIANILIQKKQIILQGPPGTGKTYTAKDIAEFLISEEVTDKENQKKVLKNSECFKLIQFHPAYSYEDFVRGITAKSNDENNGIEYKTENKILATFANDANKNFMDSDKPSEIYSKEKWLEDQIELFKEEVQNIIDIKGSYPISPTINVTNIDEIGFKYKGNNWNGIVRIDDLMIGYLDECQNRQEYKNNLQISKTASKRATYNFNLLKKLRKFIKTEFDVTNNSFDKVQLQNYVLIIDEINRANLPAVLGELIYALEYRGEEVESMYGIDGDNSLIIPPNLFIIGTMNTADRSVGHIDYAIRRRFAFVDILPDASVIVYPDAKLLFEEISTLFHSKDTLASDFKAEQVQLGHSYFIVNDEAEFQLKAKYEIVPILEEYLKDGILLEKAEEKIKELKERFGN